MERIDKIIEDLKGTCNSIDGVCADHGCDFTDLTSKELDQLDNEIFECFVCGWWCEMSEECGVNSGENTCSDCCEDEDDDY